MNSISPFHYITQDLAGISHAELAERACKSGIKWLQLRVKNKNHEEWIKIAKDTQRICKNYNTTFIVNDTISIAKEIQADGVHLGKNDLSPQEARKIVGKKTIIGGTANTFEDIQRIAKYVDYIGFGPFRFTTTKEKLSPVVGLEGFKKIVQQCKEANISIPIIAIGGITSNDVKLLLQAGVHGVAVASAIHLNANPEKIIKDFLFQLDI